jgi:general stress protein 26
VTDKTNGHGLHPRVKELASGENFAALATIMPDGHPQTQVMWVDADGDHLLINTEVHRQKFKNATPRLSARVGQYQRNTL